MPTYEFICKVCGSHFEQRLSLNDKANNARCPQGHAQTQRLFTPPAIVFKGSGFYITDNRPKEKANSQEGA